MQFILYSDIGAGAIRDRLGRPEYSYFFVMSGFRLALAELGTVMIVEHPETEVDAIYDDCVARGEDCVFFSFTPPHLTLTELRCPTVVVLAWEFDTIPTEEWDGDPRNDWRTVFARLGRAICLSSYSTRAVKAAMGEDFPVVTIAAAVPSPDAAVEVLPDGVDIRIRGTILDSQGMGFRADLLLPATRPYEPDPEDEEEEEPPELILVDEVPFHPGISELMAPGAIDDDPLTLEAPPVHPGVTALLAPAAIDTRPIPPEPPPVAAPPPSAAPPPPGFRQRLGITKRYAVEWYREAIRDLLPRRVGQAVSRLGRGGERFYRGLLGDARPAPEPVAIEAAMPPAELAVVAEPVLVAVAEPAAAPEPVEIAEPELELAPEPTPEPPPEVQVRVSGIVYTALFNPTDGRKNWMDLLTAFIYTFREMDDATLVMKIIHYDPRSYYDRLFVSLSQLAPFKCRIISLYGFLEQAEYQKLIAATRYCVSATKAEGLCLPLMEFMASGKPAVTPLHTAMEDYVDSDAGFIVYSSREQNVWPHDPRALYRTKYYRVDWDSLCDKLRESYDTLKQQPQRYHALSEHAAERVRAFASVETVREQLRRFLGLNAAPVAEAEELAVEPAAS